MTCNETIAYKDANGVLHSTKEECCAANIDIEKEALWQEMHIIYTEQFPDYLTWGGINLQPFYVQDFLENITKLGYDIIKVRDYEQDTF